MKLLKRHHSAVTFPSCPPQGLVNMGEMPASAPMNFKNVCASTHLDF